MTKTIQARFELTIFRFKSQAFIPQATVSLESLSFFVLILFVYFGLDITITIIIIIRTNKQINDRLHRSNYSNPYSINHLSFRPFVDATTQIPIVNL